MKIWPVPSELQPNYRLPSPLQCLSGELFDSLDIKILIKRDDLIHPLVSGNKWRKLHHILGRPGSHPYTHILTFGGAYSNHLLATACAGAEAGLQTIGLVRGEETRPLNHYLHLCEQFGMKLFYLDRTVYRELAAGHSDAFYKVELLKYGLQFPASQTMFLPEGGAGKAAACACETIVHEIALQCRSMNLDFPGHIILACGTGTTACGIANGLLERNIEALVQSIVVIKNGYYLEEQGATLAREGAPILYHHQYHRGGYAKTDDELTEFIGSVASQTGILLDPVYTGKAFMALIHMAKDGQFKRGERILFVHTGGILGGLSLRSQR